MEIDKYLNWMNELADQKSRPKVLLFMHGVFRLFKKMREGRCLDDQAIEKLINNPVVAGYPWWKPFLLHWQLWNWIVFKGCFKKALPRCIEILSMLEDPVFDGYPQRHYAVSDLVCIYIGMDPVGYREEILRKIDDELAVIPGDMWCRESFLSCLIEMYRFGGDLSEIGPVVDELLVRYSKLGKTRDESIAELYLDVSHVFLCRGRLQEAEEYFSQFPPNKLTRRIMKAQYWYIKGRLEMELADDEPPMTVLKQAEYAMKMATDLGYDLLKWYVHRLVGDFHRRQGCTSKALERYAEALNVMDGRGAYRDETSIALLAVELAVNANNPRAAYLLRRAEAANASLKAKRCDRKIKELRHCLENRKERCRQA